MTDDDVTAGQIRDTVSPSHPTGTIARFAEETDDFARHADPSHTTARAIANVEPMVRYIH